MSTGARVESIDALKAFRATLFKFAEESGVALGDAESEIQRTLTWLETEQLSHWQSQIRKRTELVNRAKDAVRQKKLFKDSSGRTPSAVDEEKALAIAMRQLAEAEQKLVAVKHWARRLQKELDLYKGSIQRFATWVEHEIPVAATRIDNMVAKLEEYIALAPSDASDVSFAEAAIAGFGAATTPGMGRAMPAGAPSPLPASPWAALRRQTPSSEVRGSALASTAPPSLSPVLKLEPAELEALAKASGGASELDPNSRVVVAGGIDRSQRIYLERRTASRPGDSGWYIGADAPEVPPSYASVAIADLLSRDPALRSILLLPAGSLVLLDQGRLRCILGSADENVWSAAV